MSEIFSSQGWRRLRPDFLRALLLAVLIALAWCTINDRWTAESWQTPLDYLAIPAQGDVLDTLARIKAAGDGHMLPLLYTNVPELGAPYEANWNDFPMTEKPFFCLVGWAARVTGLFVAANGSVLVGQILAGLAFYAACRLLGGGGGWSFAGGLIFALSRYAFSQGLHHVTLVYYWQIPLGLMVCVWIFRGEEFHWDKGRLSFALALAFAFGIQHVYYTDLFVQFILMGGLLQAWRHGWKAALPAAAIVGVAMSAFFLMNLNSVVYSLVNGGNDGAVVRDYKWLEIYGLKLVDMVVPPPDHPFPPFASWGAAYFGETVLSPGEQPPTAYLGLAGLGALAWLAVVSLRQAANRSAVPLETWMILWIVLYAGVGGLNGLIGTLGFELFRATTRFSIFVLCLSLMFAVRQLSLRHYGNSLWVYGLAFLGVVVALWDQTPPIVSADAIKVTAVRVASDRAFTEQMEKRLPAQAMVFQLPIMDFPESPIPNVSSYEHFRPYLYSHQLRFSFGADKGRSQEQWQHTLAGLPPAAAVSQLESYGFAALYLNLHGFPDKGAALIKSLTDMGRGDMFTSASGDLLGVILKPSATPVKPDGF